MIMGVLAILIGLFAGEISSNLHSSWSTPVDTLGNWVISVTPHWTERFAINLFGRHDKAFLVSLILIIGLALGALGGHFWRKSDKSVFYGVVLAETLFGITATLLRPHAGIFAIAPWCLCGCVAIVSMEIIGIPTETVSLELGTSSQRIGSERREFISLAAAVVGLGALTAVTGRSVKAGAVAAVKRLAIALPKPSKALPALPADPAGYIPGLSTLITPAENFYQIDTAINPPLIDPTTWRLTITGMVKNPLSFTYEEILQRPLFELDDTMSCVSNPVGGPLIGNARWLGCRLDDLINEAEPLGRADQILASSADGFGAGFPVSTLDGRDAMIAVGMNGEPLPVKHGYPARVIVPGLYGYVSATKWVTNIELTRFDLKQGFWISRGWSQLGPIKMESRIDTPTQGENLKNESTYIAGVAWAPDDGISEVQVNIDGTWQTATLGPELSGTTWRQWWLSWTPTIGNHQISVRAINKKGQSQTQAIQDVAPDGATGWHQIVVNVG